LNVPASTGSLLALLLALACGGDAAPPAVTAKVERGRIERVVVATGTIEPAREVEVRPRIPGIVERIHVEPGDPVVEGQLLVEIDRELLASQADEAEAEFSEAQVALRYAGIELQRAEQLVKQGAQSAQHLDEVRSRQEAAAARVAAAKAKRDTLATQLGYTRVSSPLAGRVLDVPVEEGSAVSPVTAVTGGTLLLSLAATSTLHLEGLVDENEVVRVAVDQPARLRTEAFGERTFEGRVRKISPVGQRIQNVTYFEVEVDVTDANAQLLRPRMSGDAEIVTEVVEDALLVPEAALRYRGEQVYVEARDGAAGFAPRDVRIGIVDGSRVQVAEGLVEGDEVTLR
jgi:RND family efflux transporter MFP subunit